MKARVFVTLKPSVFDPQGSTIAGALHSLGFDAVSDVRQGKYFELDLNVASAGEAEKLAAEVADRVLANPVIESFRVELASRLGGRSRMTFAVIVFPGSNCDHDAYHAAKHVLGQDARFVWHKETSLAGRGRRHPARRVFARRLSAHRRHRAVLAGHGARDRNLREQGGPVLGVCNGFQILLECGLLPGAMLRNRDVKFHCEFVGVRVERTDTPFTVRARAGQVLRFRSRTGKATTSRRPTRWRSSKPRVGSSSATSMPPASRPTPPTRTGRHVTSPASAASRRNVVGLMPHPERACESPLGSTDGLVLFESVVDALRRRGSLEAAS